MIPEPHLLNADLSEIYRKTARVPKARTLSSLHTACLSLLCFSFCALVLCFGCLCHSGFGKGETVVVKESPNKVVWAQNPSSCLFAPQ